MKKTARHSYLEKKCLKSTVNDKLALLAEKHVLPPSFNCNKCHHKCQAECCTMVPLDPALIEKYKHLIQREIIDKIQVYDYIIPVTHSKRCAFLKENFQCAIYENRPNLCKIYGTEINEDMKCHYMDKKGNERTFAG